LIQANQKSVLHFLSSLLMLSRNKDVFEFFKEDSIGKNKETLQINSNSEKIKDNF